MSWSKHLEFQSLQLQYCAITMQQNLKGREFSKSDKHWVLKMIGFCYFGVWAQQQNFLGSGVCC